MSRMSVTCAREHYSSNYKKRSTATYFIHNHATPPIHSSSIDTYIPILQKKRNASKTLAPPGPRGLPFVGNLHQFASATASGHHVFLHKISQKYGPIVQMKLRSAKSAKEVLKTQDLSFCSRPNLFGQQRLAYNASDITFSPYGDYWREVRKITAVHLFSSKKTQSFRPIREEEISHMIEMIKGISHSASTNLRVVNLSDMAMALGSTLICRVAFGKRYDDRGMEIRRFEKLSREAQGLMGTFYLSDFFPLFGWVVDRLNGSIHHVNRICGDLDSFYQELIDEHLDPE